MANFCVLHDSTCDLSVGLISDAVLFEEERFGFIVFLLNAITGWPLFWKTWKSQAIEKWSGKSQGKWEKSGKMNYYNYSVAVIIVQTEICLTLWISYTFLCKPIFMIIIPLEYIG